MEKRASQILDIHTHKSEDASQGKSIINYRLSADLSVDMLRREDKRMAPGERYFYSAGLHPWELTESNAEEQLEYLHELLKGEQFVAVGEAGLDKLAAAPMELQLEMFAKQVMLSESLGLPLIIHCVKAMEELLAVKKKLHPVQPWIWHGFRGKPDQARQLMRAGIFLSFGVHYPEETMLSVPVEQMFLETDDSPEDIEDLLCRAAEIRGVGEEELRQSIRENIQKVFFRG